MSSSVDEPGERIRDFPMYRRVASCPPRAGALPDWATAPGNGGGRATALVEAISAPVRRGKTIAGLTGVGARVAGTGGGGGGGAGASSFDLRDDVGVAGRCRGVGVAIRDWGAGGKGVEWVWSDAALVAGTAGRAKGIDDGARTVGVGAREGSFVAAGRTGVTERVAED